MVSNLRNIGKSFETRVINAMSPLGFVLVTRNYSVYGKGEIDLIFAKNKYIVFVEVRSRRNTNFGLPEESISNHKKFKIHQVASNFIYSHKKFSSYKKKFILVSYSKINDKYKIKYYEF